MTIALVGFDGILAERLSSTSPEAVVIADARTLEEDAPAGDFELVIQDVRHRGDEADSLERATYGVWLVYERLRPRRHVLLSSLRVFDSYDPGWEVTAAWHPRPSADPVELVPYLAELTVRELTRVRSTSATILRLDSAADILVDGELERILELAVDTDNVSLRVEHGPATRAVTAAKTPSLPRPAAPMRSLARPTRAALFGAGGPLGAAVTNAAAAVLPLVLSDAVPLQVRADAHPQTPGAPIPSPVEPPNVEVVADITDASAVSSLAEGADCLINCTVVRNDARGAFRVNLLGALFVMQAAVEHGIPRVVHTGPAFATSPHPYGYAQEHGLVGPVPPRAGDDIYLLTKLLALEVCRVYAEQFRIACPTLLFIQLTDPIVGKDAQAHPFVISWDDAGRAIVAAALVESLPQPFTVMHIQVESPHGRFAPGDAWSLLGIEPKDNLDHLWYRSTTEGDAG